MAKGKSKPVVKVFLFLRVLKMQNGVFNERYYCLIVVLLIILSYDFVFLFEEVLINVDRVMICPYYLN